MPQTTEPRSPGELWPARTRRREVAHALLDQLLDDLERLPREPVLDAPSQPELLQRLDEPMPRAGLGLEDTLQRFWTHVRPHMTRVDHPRFHAFVPSPSSFPALLGQMISSATNPFVGSWLGGASVAALELLVLRWISEAIAYPSTCGILTSGGSIANLNALIAARQATAARFGDLSRGQLIDRAAIYVSDQVHDSVLKSARVAGFPASAVRTVATDSDLRMQADALDTAIARDRREEPARIPVLVCANGGTTNTGAVDPLRPLAEVCRRHDVWFHVDAAYGGFAAMTARARPLFDGLALADSITLDPHKWLYTPMGVGCFLTLHESSLAQAFETSGAYLRDVPREQVNFFDRGPELSRPGRALVLWTLLRSVGVTELTAQIDRDLELALVAEERLRQSGRFDLLAPTSLSVVTFAVAQHLCSNANTATRAVYARVLERGRAMVSTTEVGERLALRLVVLNPRTDERELETSLAELIGVADEVLADA